MHKPVKLSDDVISLHLHTINQAFSELSPKTAVKLFENAEIEMFKARQTITGLLDRDHSLYIVLSGVVKVNIDSPNGDRVSLLYLTKGDVFGELAAIDHQDRSAFCQAKTDVILFKIHDDRVWHLIETLPDFNRSLLKLLSKRIRQTNDKLFRIGKHTAKQRVLSELLRLASCKENKGVIGFIPTHQDIADLALVSREQTSRVFAGLQNDGLLVKEDKNIILTDIQRIQMLIEGEKD
jgi:CRP-like cAMP-binding protein